VIFKLFIKHFRLKPLRLNIEGKESNYSPCYWTTQYVSGIGGHDPNAKDKDELGHVPSFLPAYSLCNSDSNSISV